MAMAAKVLESTLTRLQQRLKAFDNDFSATIFGYNTLHLPNILDVPGTESVTGVEHYKARIFPILSGSQYLFIPQSQANDAHVLAQYHREFDVTEIPRERIYTFPDTQQSLSETILHSPDIQALIKQLPGERIEPFYVSKNVEKIAQLSGRTLSMSANITERLNHKFHARQYLQDAGLNVPESRLFCQQQKHCMPDVAKQLNYLKNKGFHQYSLTRPESCAGQGLFPFHCFDEAEAIIQQHISTEETFIIEPWIAQQIASPSIQVLIGDKAEDCLLIGLTDQILNGSVHTGNIYPSQFANDHTFTQMIEKLTETLRKRGARGIIGADFIVTEDPKNGKRDYYVIEINARQTGAIYGGLLAMKLNCGYARPWLCHNYIPIKPDMTVSEYVQHLDDLNIHYRPGKTEGVLLVSNACFADNKAMVLCMADRTERLHELLAGAKAAAEEPN